MAAKLAGENPDEALAFRYSKKSER